MSAEKLARWIEADVDRVMASRHEAIERACEVALVGGVCGVSVYDDVAVVDPGVPYGMVHYHPGSKAEAEM